MISIAESLVSWYRMRDNRASTRVVDEKGKHYGTAQQNTSVIFSSNAFAFNGTTDYIDSGYDFVDILHKNMSISLWVKPDDGQTALTQVFLGAEADEETSAQFEIHQTNGNLYLMTNKSGNFNIDAHDSAFNDGQETWHHIVTTLKQVGSNVVGNVYLDGTLLASDTSAGALSVYANEQNLGLGAQITEGGASSFFDGLMKDVMIFNRALSADEVKELYNSGKGVYYFPERFRFSQFRDRVRS